MMTRAAGDATTATIVWLRHDLRVADHPALCAAVEAGGPVIPVFILDLNAGRAPGAAGLWWLDKSLRALAERYAALGSPLVLRAGDTVETLQRVVHESGARRIVASRRYDKPGLALEEAVSAAAAKWDVTLATYAGELLKAPWEIKTGAGGDYRVFTPYLRAFTSTVEDLSPLDPPARLTAPAKPLASDALDAWKLHPSRSDWSSGFDWKPGEDGARASLDTFLHDRLGDYPEARNRPGHDGSSQLSPHLHWGELSPRQVWRAVEARAPAHGSEGRDKFLAEIVWREFSHHVLFHHPDLADESFNDRMKRLKWRRAPVEFTAWTKGFTGYPIVDAGMRQLWTRGWMHNRARMITASFLIKDLLIDWRDGERWFWDALVDADEANNPLNWQWVAGSGPDASPFFRVFNPVSQGVKFDPHGEYIRRWVPELARLPDAFVHTPWAAPPATLAEAGVTIGRTYPAPMVDHAMARDRALAAFRATQPASVDA